MPMYELKPVYGDNGSATMDLPRCMYKMNNVHEAEMISPQMQELEIRQLRLLEQLESIKIKMMALSAILGHDFGTEIPSKQLHVPLGITNANSSASNLSLFHIADELSDFVISVSPSEQALSTVLIADLLKQNGIDVCFSTHRHSSLKEEICETKLNVTGGLNGRLMINTKQLIFTFIWKNEPLCPYMMFSTAKQTPIHGDVNIARHICRSFVPQLYNDSNPVEMAAVDKWIEVSKKILHDQQKEKDSGIKSLNSHLGTNTYLALNRLTLADVVNFSAIISCLDSFKILPKNVKQWFSLLATNFSQTMKDIGPLPVLKD